MENATYIALSRLDTEQRAMSVVADNIANASTTGFKSQHVLFSDYLSPQDGSDLPKGAENEAYTQDLATWRDLSQGQLQQTGNPLDIAIGGEGYFTLRTATGIRLSRSGRFQQRSDGMIADDAGNPLLDRAGQPIRVPAVDHTLTIASDGTISGANGVIARIGVVIPQDQHKLLPEGGKFLRADTPTTQAPAPKLVQGMIESSNVQLMPEMTHMLQIQRDFQFVAQFVESEATRQQDAISKILQVNV
ncbi:flagellar basal-body rod protein FlgF [Acidomonas methanolica]|uniref:Flagellar basal-body rod protein FlgF n=1 Tax=Acidomonas methanolica NBRC 104435 TaxID=1231351 RepID=A0A023D5T3_ACIMT|nr:flagellar basal-body rod protein FlgF [Acidomonas methanolica]MBU2653836.1 flagellar basal-body rod protein FlgF [Acidomonas methanolica]TCS20559.1 flagellar basal-body rod protein FlgF [Acidomonas methanolica]GAJ29151.1 flagellar basal body rod protein FlgF/FlgG [Acidomonas methanolica NBRC 104435]GBQ54591.1 flagellar basal body rod protein FlgF [Acidomonas methanolica]GEL00535.1 flagellar basal-body rod protein FlgF [Acidomonas methanolica NBRC 104435]